MGPEPQLMQDGGARKTHVLRHGRGAVWIGDVLEVEGDYRQRRLAQGVTSSASAVLDAKCYRSVKMRRMYQNMVMIDAKSCTAAATYASSGYRRSAC